MELHTPRLRLVPLAAEHLVTLIDEPDRFAERFGYAAARGLREFLTSGEVSPAWMERLRASSGVDPWRHGFAMVDTAGYAIGMASFKGPPDGAGVVEISYGVTPAYEGKGFTTETAAALVDFALRDERVRTVCAHTLPERNASVRVLEKNGFRFAGEVVDPEDGPVWRWERAR